MDKFHLLNVYIAVSQSQGFAAAARQLNMSAPAVTRAIASLEEQLGVKLLHRTTRHVRATEVGLRYLEDAKRIMAQINAADEAACGINAQPQGLLVVTAPVLFGRLFVTPCIVEYLSRYPNMDIDALFLDRVVNLLEEGIDVGLRIGELADSSMRAKKVGYVRLLTCASPSYIAASAPIAQPSDLTEHSIIASTAGSGSIHWRFAIQKGTSHPTKVIKIKPRLRVTTNDAAIAACEAGLGITRVLSYQISEQLRSGSLQIVLEEHQSSPKPVHIVHREGRNGAVKVRAFVDLLAEQLSHQLALN